MATNPIKRRARQSFFLGFLIALVVMAVVVMLLFTRISSLNEENEKLKMVGPKMTVYTVADTIEQGQEITFEDLQPTTIQLSYGSTSLNIDNYIDDSIFFETDEITGEEKELSYTARVQIPTGSVVTLSMLQQGGVEKTERLMEYSVVVLPSQLNNGDFVDIRLRLASGTELTVLSKKKVEQCTADTVWIKMNEEEIQTMNSAIVDAYTTVGSQLRAVVYTNPLMQDPSEANYPINNAVLASMATNPNILRDAMNNLYEKWQNAHSDPNSSLGDYYLNREVINSYLTSQDESDKASEVEAGISEETSKQSENRNNYVTALEGTGMVGTTY